MDLTSFLFLCFHLYLISTIILLLLDNRESSTTFAWLFVFIIFPVGGLIIYFLIGRNWRHINREKELSHQLVENRIHNVFLPLIQHQKEWLDQLLSKEERSLAFVDKLFRLLAQNSNSILTMRNAVKVFYSGKNKFDAVKNDLRNAKKFIYLEYYIWRSDKLTQEIKEILIQKAQSGVEVKILYDALGSLFLNRKYIKELRKAGVKIYPYYDFLSLFTVHTLNYRNHRKIVVIDGTVGYTGGMNMGEEYVTGGKKFSFWRDTHMRIEGQAAAVLQSIFITSWFNTTGEDLFNEENFFIETSIDGQVPIQITTSGPDSEWESIKQLFFVLISSAQNRVYIQTPYFIPDPSVYTALKTAALSGIDVRLMLTGVPDKRLPFWSAYTYFENLLKAGVKIYHYEKGFLHAKTVVVDGKVSSIGSANIDIRSFHLNYEISTLLYDREVSQDLEKQFLLDLEDCEQLTEKVYEDLRPLIKLRNSMARLFAPLL